MAHNGIILPVDLLHEALCYLTLHEFHACSKVCRYWADLFACDPVLRASLSKNDVIAFPARNDFERSLLNGTFGRYDLPNDAASQKYACALVAESRNLALLKTLILQHSFEFDARILYMAAANYDEDCVTFARQQLTRVNKLYATIRPFPLVAIDKFIPKSFPTHNGTENVLLSLPKRKCTCVSELKIAISGRVPSYGDILLEIYVEFPENVAIAPNPMLHVTNGHVYNFRFEKHCNMEQIGPRKFVLRHVNFIKVYTHVDVFAPEGSILTLHWLFMSYELRNAYPYFAFQYGADSGVFEPGTIISCYGTEPVWK